MGPQATWAAVTRAAPVAGTPISTSPSLTQQCSPGSRASAARDGSGDALPISGFPGEVLLARTGHDAFLRCIA